MWNTLNKPLPPKTETGDARTFSKLLMLTGNQAVVPAGRRLPREALTDLGFLHPVGRRLPWGALTNLSSAVSTRAPPHLLKSRTLSQRTSPPPPPAPPPPLAPASLGNSRGSAR